MSKSLTLIDLEDFLPVLQLDGKHNGIEDDHFIQKQYEHFIKITSLNTALDHKEHSNLQKFKSFVFQDSEDYKKNKIRRNYLFNLIYSKYMFDIQSIKSQNVFNNFYFSNEGNGLIKQSFVAAMQALFTIALLIEIVIIFEDIDFHNELNLGFAVIVTYLSFVLIKPGISSIVHDLKILGTYFHLLTFNATLNISTNIIIASMLPWCTFFIIIDAGSVADIILNATAIAFIIELDDEAADEVDLKNWFASATSSFEDIFKKVIEFNHPIITYDGDDSEMMRNRINQEIHKVRDALRCENTKLEYFESDLCGKIKHIMKDIALFILMPITIYKHPFNIMLDVCRRIQRNTVIEENASKKKHVQIKTKETMTYTMVENKEDEEEPTKQHIAGEASINEQHTKKVNTDYEREQITKALKLNDEANAAMDEYRYNEAHRKYTQGIKLLIDAYKAKDEDYECKYDGEHDDIFDATIFKSQSQNVILLRVICILYFNNGFALYRRAKQSWISEVVTNDNGHPFTNYNNARKSCRVCIECLSYLSQDLQLGENKRSAMCHKLLSYIYYDLYQFTESEQHYMKYINIFTHKHDDKRLQQIQQRKYENHAQYLKILDDARKHIFVDEDECGHRDEKCPFKHLRSVCEDLEDNKQSRTELDALIGKFHWFCSEYNAKEMSKYSDMHKRMEEDRNKYERMSNEMKQMEDDLKNPELKLESQLNKMEEKTKLESQFNQMNLQEINLNIQAFDEKKKEFTDKRVAEAQKAHQRDDLYGWSLFNTDLSADEEQLRADIIATFTNSIEFEPDQPYYYFIRGLMYYDMERNMDALHDFEKAQKLNDRNPLFKLRCACSNADVNGWDSIKTSAFVLKMMEPVIQLKNTLIAKQQLRILSAYYTELEEDQEGMNAKAYTRFLNRPILGTTRELFQMCGAFDTLCADDGLIHVAEFETIAKSIVVKATDAKDGDMINYNITVEQQVYGFLGYLQNIQAAQKHLDQSEFDAAVHINDYMKEYKELQDKAWRELVIYSHFILHRIQEINMQSDVLTEDQWTRFVKMLPRSLIEMYDSKGISKQFADSPDLNQRVLEQHSVNFERYQIRGIIDRDQFKLIVETLTYIQGDSKFCL